MQVEYGPVERVGVTQIMGLAGVEPRKTNPLCITMGLSFGALVWGAITKNRQVQHLAVGAVGAVLATRLMGGQTAPMQPTSVQGWG